MKYCYYYEYLPYSGSCLFTLICLPSESGKFPTVIYRTPYVDNEENITEEDISKKRMNEFSFWLDAGYAVVFQHCRGRGKSSGDCVPYIFEREDGLFLQSWIRQQPFYNGELYFCGGSYTSSVHLVTAPFADDIKGAIIEVQDSERYNCNYRNGFYKMGLHGCWYVNMYKKKSSFTKSFTPDSFKMLPLSEFSNTVFGERAEDFDEILRHPDKNDDFWNTRFGGGEARKSVANAKIPILLVTGFYDIYTGGIFDMWRELDDETRSLCALAVHPYDHWGKSENQPIAFKNAALNEAFGNYKVKWLDSIRGKCSPPFERGKITYYKLFDDSWCCDDLFDADGLIRIKLGEGKLCYKYNPYAPASFKGGLSANFGGNEWQDEPNSRYDITSLYSAEFEKDIYVKGKIKAKLKVASDCEDTCFYLRLSLCKAEGDYGLRDDINKISNFDPEYEANKFIDMEFSFDEHAFVVRKGEKIRIDISSSAFPHYVPHTNLRGPFAEQTTAKVANNTVVLEESYVELPILTCEDTSVISVNE